MKSMTIHKMDAQLVEAIETIAEARGQSINAAIKELLSQAVGVQTGESSGMHERGYRRFLKRWSPDDAAAFEHATRDFSTVDESDWT